MINKPFEMIKADDINILVANSIPENKTLEYKEILPLNSDADRKEFLADISALANSAGGDIIYGVSEKRDNNGKTTGLPDVALGLSSINVDEQIRRLDNMLRDGLAPRVNGIRIQSVDGFPNGPVIFVRVPKSWTAPHMIAKGDSRFYSRNNAGKYPLDVMEIRSAFALSEELPEKIRRFRDDRISKIANDDAPVPLGAAGKVVLHIYPLLSGETTYQINLHQAANDPSFRQLIYYPADEIRYNFDGLISYGDLVANHGRSYVQLYRNGIIEAVDIRMLRNFDEKSIPSLLFEEKLLAAFQRFMELEQKLDVQPPFVVMLSLVDVKGYKMATGHHQWPDEIRPIDRNILLLPDILIEDHVASPSSILKPIFDVVWQAAGWRGSLNYDEEGNRTG